ncbi:hexokinase-4-like isoform X2 [Littorina saxatilis]|uniref:hexokinase-4-like isoform X2 n=1 Tax=Littorina saxatilis TaxID=31220 RepID=UPI0038B6724A
MQVLDQEMSKGLNNETNIQADIKMFPTFVNLSPNVSGSEDMLVMDLNDKRLKVSLVTLQGQNASLNKPKCYKCYKIQKGVRRETVQQLFDFVADSTHDFVKFHRVPTKTLRLVLNIAFPCKHESIDKGYLVKWTKEVEFGEVDGTHLHILLQEALDRKRQTKKDNLAKLKLVAIVNNAVSTLVSVAHGNSNCKIGLIVGRGLNACYLEDWKRVAKDSPEDVALHEMVINTELGALGENVRIDFCRTDYDNKLDMNSIRPGSQILEKMVGGMYIGEIVRLVLDSLTKDRLLFPSESTLFEREDMFDIEFVAIIEEDTKEPFAKTASILDGFKLKHYTPEDLRTVREVCKVVCERAALLTAASLAVLINRVNQPEVRVVADGYLYRRHPRFHDILDQKTRELVRPELKFDIVSPSDESSIGAARIAAAALRKQNSH